MKSETISVIMPVYNSGEWLDDALQSLQCQTFDRFEAIIVDDGSTDNSGVIAQKYAGSDPRFKVLTQPNGGVSKARNSGLDHARGEWIAFMDADDVMPPEGLEVLIGLAKKNDVGIVAGSFARGIPGKAQYGKDSNRTVPSDTALLMGLYQKKILNNPWGMLFHSTVFNGRDPLRFRNCRYEDLDIFYRAFERVDRICITDRIVYYYRDTPGSFINKWTDQRLDVLDVTDRISNHMKHRGVALYRAAQDRRFSAHFNMLVEMERRSIDNPEKIDRCMKVIKEERLNELTDRNVRLKNKIGALLSYFGLPAIKSACKLSRYLRKN